MENKRKANENMDGLFQERYKGKKSKWCRDDWHERMEVENECRRVQVKWDKSRKMMNYKKYLAK